MHKTLAKLAVGLDTFSMHMLHIKIKYQIFGLEINCSGWPPINIIFYNLEGSNRK